MKNIFSLAAVALTSVCLFTACADDNDSNPTVVVPSTFTVNTPEFANTTVDLKETETIHLTWTAPQFTDLGAPLAANGGAGLVYDVEVSKSGTFTKSYTEALADTVGGKAPAGYDYVTFEKTETGTAADILCDSINRALNVLQTATEAWTEDSSIDPLKVSVRLKAKVVDASKRVAASIYSNVVEFGAQPYWTDLNKGGGAAYLWVPGNGNGWNHGECPVLISEDNNGVYVGYAYMDGDFKFTLQPAWADEYNNGTFTSASDCISLGDQGGGNISYTGEPGLCYVVVNVSDPENATLDVTPVKWGVVGAFNGWSVDDGTIIDMHYDKAEKALVAEDVALDGEWKFARDNAWTVNFGGAFDALEQNGSNFNTPAGTYKVLLYIENAQKGYHAEVK